MTNNQTKCGIIYGKIEMWAGDDERMINYERSNGSLWKQYKYIAFIIFSCKILIISYKMLIITRISNEKTIELTVH